jgi:hypothetical protein
MELNFSVPGEVSITMVDYLKWAIEDFPKETTGRATPPHAENLFTTRPEKDREPLKKEIYCLPPFCCTAPIHNHEVPQGHPDLCDLPDHTSMMPQ